MATEGDAPQAGGEGVRSDRVAADLRGARRRLLLDAVGIGLSVLGFGVVYGLSARNAGFSSVEAVATSVLAFAGAAQLAAVGYLEQGLAWPAIVVLTALLNARHLLYSAALAPRLRGLSWRQRAVMAHVLTDEAFALSAAHFQRVGRTDVVGFWVGGLAATFVPWNIGTLVGVYAGGVLPDPTRYGLDVVFPAAMAGLAVGLVTGRRTLVAAAAGALVGVALAVLLSPGIGIVAGGLLGPLAGLAVPERSRTEVGP